MGQNNVESQFISHNDNLHKQSKSNTSETGETQGVRAGELSCTCTRLFDQVPGHLLPTLSYCSSPAARALTSHRNGSRYLFFKHWDEMPGQKEKVCAGDADIWQLRSKSCSHLRSRQ